MIALGDCAASAPGRRRCPWRRTGSISSRGCEHRQHRDRQLADPPRRPAERGQRGQVHVVAARVHGAGPRRPRHAGLLGDRQRVEFGAERDARASRPPIRTSRPVLGHHRSVRHRRARRPPAPPSGAPRRTARRRRAARAAARSPRRSSAASAARSRQPARPAASSSSPKLVLPTRGRRHRSVAEHGHASSRR